VPIHFQINSKKTLEVLVWLLNKKPGMTRYTIVKVLYYADKAHLEQHGRPILGDRYIAMDDGMVPSHALDMLEGDRRNLYADADIKPIEEAIVTLKDGKYDAYRATREAETEHLSRTDIECLAAALKCYGHLTFNELYDLAHSEVAWKKAWNTRQNSEMDYAEIIAQDHPRRKELIERLEETSEHVVF
jgi:uncharacterized phage-associated protein